MSKSKKYFEAHPDVNEFYVTEDGNHFFEPNTAANHAVTLKSDKRKITKVLRNGEEEEVEDVKLESVDDPDTSLKTAADTAVAQLGEMSTKLESSKKTEEAAKTQAVELQKKVEDLAAELEAKAEALKKAEEAASAAMAQAEALQKKLEVQPAQQKGAEGASKKSGSGKTNDKSKKQ